jgi:hypothetical protein
MKWLEILSLRSAGNRLKLLEHELLKLVTEIEDQKGLLEMRLYRNGAVDTDLSLHLRWESPRVENEGSSLGLRLVHLMEEFGLINHSVWVEEERRQI